MARIHQEPDPRRHPFEVICAGFRGDSVTLQRHGWQFFVEMDHARLAYRIALRGPGSRGGGVLLLTAVEQWDTMFRFDAPLVFNAMPPAYDIHIDRQAELNFRPVDTEKAMEMEYVALCHERRPLRPHLDEVFPPPDDWEEDTQIVVPDEQTVDDLLSLILKQQLPVQAELRKRNKDEGMRQKSAIVVPFQKVA